jgi:hypothetical protein
VARTWVQSATATGLPPIGSQRGTGRRNRHAGMAEASHGKRSARLADDQRDVALGTALVTDVARVGRHHLRPQLRLLSGDARRARIGRRRPAMVNSMSGSAIRLRYQSGSRSSPPLEATSTTRSPSTTGAVSMVERGRPDLRPTVCDSTTGIPKAGPSTWPPLRWTMAWCTRLTVFRPISVRYWCKRRQHSRAPGNGRHATPDRCGLIPPAVFLREVHWAAGPFTVAW